jgi:hypothetical protein
MTLATPTTGLGHAFTVPDGSRITLDAPGLTDGDVHWNCLFVAKVHGAGHAFTVCRRGTAEQLVAALLLTDVRVEPYRGVDVLLVYDTNDYTATEHGETLAAWRGRWHELHTARTGPRLGPAAFTRVFDAFTLTDMPEGLLVRPRSARKVTFESFTVFRNIPGLGDLQIQRPHESNVVLPRWRGAAARAGEVWRRPFADGSGRGRSRPETLILATPTAICELSPGPLDTADGDAAVDFLVRLDITWTPA